MQRTLKQEDVGSAQLAASNRLFGDSTQTDPRVFRQLDQSINPSCDRPMPPGNAAHTPNSDSPLDKGGAPAAPPNYVSSLAAGAYAAA